jgi:hypothetical protein
VSIDERPVALPKLYGAPAYARPPVAVALSPRPFDPDQMPLEVYRTDDERRFAEHLPARSYVSAMDGNGNGNGSGPAIDGSNSSLRPRSFNLRAIAGRLLGGE